MKSSIYNTILKQLAKASRKNRDGPSLQRFYKTGKLIKYCITPNTYYTSHTLTSVTQASRTFRKLQHCIKKHMHVVNMHSAHHSSSSAHYIHYVIQHGKHHFHDDVELVLKGRVIFIRSSSRKGIYDMGVNNKRVEKIQKCSKMIR